MIVKSSLNLEEGDIQSLQPPARLKTSNAVWCDPLFFSLEGDVSVSVRSVHCRETCVAKLTLFQALSVSLVDLSEPRALNLKIFQRHYHLRSIEDLFTAAILIGQRESLIWEILAFSIARANDLYRLEEKGCS